MLTDRNGHPVDPEARLRGRVGLVPVSLTCEQVRSAAQFAAHHLTAELRPNSAQHYAMALGVLLYVLPFAERSAEQAPPHARESFDSSDRAADAWALACYVVQTADLIARGCP